MHNCIEDACLWHDHRFVDEYLQVSESTCLEAMVKFATEVVKVFGSGYLEKQLPKTLSAHGTDGSKRVAR